MASETTVKRKKHPEKALSALKIKSAKPGRYADGNGLYLVVDDSGHKTLAATHDNPGQAIRSWIGRAVTCFSGRGKEEAARLRMA